MTEELRIRAPRLRAGSTVWAAYSGGIDSTVLLHALQAAGIQVRAIHVNHHLQPAAAGWADHCRGVAGSLGIPLYVIDVEVDPRDPAGPEAAARNARYAGFRSVMRPGDCLATAHNRDDQAETVLLRLVRGAGVTGLAAMRPLSPMPPHVLWRPLLAWSRAQIRQYADRHGLRWIEDPHNRDPRYSRSFVRSEILARLAQRWPSAGENLARAAEHCAEAAGLLEELAATDRRRVQARDGLAVRRLLALPDARRNNVLRSWVAECGFELPPASALARVGSEVLRARPDAAPVLGWGRAEWRRFRDTLYLMARLPPAPSGVVLEWDGRTDLALPAGCGILRVRRTARTELPLRVVFMRGGERIKPAGSRYTRTLRNLFQEDAVPPWVRERMPFIEHDGELGSLAGGRETARFRALRRRSGLRFEWAHELVGAR